MRGLRRWVYQTVIVSASGFDAKGRLAEVRGGVIVLKEAVALNGETETPVDGILAIPESQVRYVQVP